MIPVEKVEYKKKDSMVRYPDTSNLEPGQPLFTEPQPMYGRGIAANPQLNTTAMEAALRALQRSEEIRAERWAERQRQANIQRHNRNTQH